MTDTDSERFATYGRELADAVENAIPDWVTRSVHLHLGQRLYEDSSLDQDHINAQARRSGAAAARDVGTRLRDLLGRDVDRQWTNPLSVVRDATSYPTEILALYGATQVHRNDQAVRMLPDDVYNLAPANFAALGPEVHECGIRWGAAKAHLHRQRHKKS